MLQWAAFTLVLMALGRWLPVRHWADSFQSGVRATRMAAKICDARLAGCQDFGCIVDLALLYLGCQRPVLEGHPTNFRFLGFLVVIVIWKFLGQACLSQSIPTNVEDHQRRSALLHTPIHAGSLSIT